MRHNERVSQNFTISSTGRTPMDTKNITQYFNAMKNPLISIKKYDLIKKY